MFAAMRGGSIVEAFFLRLGANAEAGVVMGFNAALHFRWAILAARAVDRSSQRGA